MGESKMSNFESFLDSTCARVSLHYPPETCGSYSSAKDEQSQSQAPIELRHFWDAYEDWSTYGVSVPLWIEDTAKLTQYYTPYLSAIQIFTKPKQIADDSSASSSSSSSRTLVAGKSGEVSAECSAQGSDPHRFLTADHLGNLYFQYNETDKPIDRTPLTYMIAELAEKHHGLFSLKTAELSQYSWLSIAWYPIYQIPSMKYWRELSACFLTYHGLTPTIPGGKVEDRCKGSTLS
ncbi:PREDICTED: uncharacterized protein LOC104818383 isoform X2 [Tarenaya hassleriana]|uniref:uncharacterized protein LOC104818383 isoform X2 n=1 Tax=Tarenaya hassleriana TaxID=28532 RepID=UPI0008FCEDEE|nr:PREDICTED: uncharacterized protein LOC104818383 isoform X2 [Tarenaya hassleriana]